MWRLGCQRPSGLLVGHVSANHPSSGVAWCPGGAPEVPSFVIQVQLFLQGRGSEAEDGAWGFRPGWGGGLSTEVPSPGGVPFSLRATPALGRGLRSSRGLRKGREGTGQAAPAVCGAATGLLSWGRLVGASGLLARSATRRANAATALPARSGGRQLRSLRRPQSAARKVDRRKSGPCSHALKHAPVLSGAAAPSSGPRGRSSVLQQRSEGACSDSPHFTEEETESQKLGPAHRRRGFC